MARYIGSALYLEFIHAGGTAVLSGTYREFTINDELTTVDATAGSDAAMVELPSFKNIEWSMTVLDETASQPWEGLTTGLEGTLRYSPNGTATSNRKRTVASFIKKLEQTFTYNDVAQVNIDGKGTAAITEATW